MSSGNSLDFSSLTDVDLLTPEPRPEREHMSKQKSPGHSILSPKNEGSIQMHAAKLQLGGVPPCSFAVVVPAPEHKWEYEPFHENMTVETVLEELDPQDDEPSYKIEYEDGRREEVSLEKLMALQNGRHALDIYNNGGRSEDDSEDGDHSNSSPGMSSMAIKRVRKKSVSKGFIDSISVDLDSEYDEIAPKRRKLRSNINSDSRYGSRASSRISRHQASRPMQDDDSDFNEHIPPRSPFSSRGRRLGSLASQRVMQGVNSQSNFHKIYSQNIQSDDESDSQSDELGRQGPESDKSDIYMQPGQKLHRVKSSRVRSNIRKRGMPQKAAEISSLPNERPSRRSGRERITKDMRERDVDEEIYADEDPSNAAPKVISIREIFQPISNQDPFCLFHTDFCDVCNGPEANSNKGNSPLIHCQGCSTSIHKVCLGYRSSREHMVTKIGHESFAMQCRRCIGVAIKKDPNAPRLDVCQGCRKPGRSCAAFTSKKTAKQEKLREENDGDDPITEVSGDLVNRAENILFRCVSCQRASHFEHLPPLSKKSSTSDNVNQLRQLRLYEYSRSWQCQDCCNSPGKAQGLVCWRPLDHNSYIDGQTAHDFCEDQREYLIKWEGKSYFKCTWMPGSWVWGVTAHTMRKAFFRRDDEKNIFPKWSSEEAVPEEYLRMDIIFEVRYNSSFRPSSENMGKATINMIDQVFVKFQGLSYEEAVWEKPPDPEDRQSWSDFFSAYNEYLAGIYFKQAPVSTIKERIEAFRKSDFSKQVELKKQPAVVTGEMMSYQMDGVNWLLYNFHQRKNVILADEMGLGKTVQVIAFFAALVMNTPKCWPFLVVTPNSTCSNWRREIKKWAPSLRVVSYYGVKTAREMAMKYEMYPNDCSDLRAHVVVTSYEAPIDEHSRSWFKIIKWAGLVVDEGQRLKNDGNLLYIALKALKIPFQVLLTGTPLQNNKRELFNLLQFLDPSINAARLDEEYEELTKENLPALHELIRPFFLRRTKLQVLKFLPPMANVILPVTMSVVQKKLYKSILAKNPALIRSIFGTTKAVLGPKERGNLNNMLMQLRKCLCHPFLYSSAIEERSVNEVDLYRNLVDASSKFQLLEIMLPKLQERGHRILIFSQFLNNLDLVEDFLTGLGLRFQRLDGSVSSLEKQRRIDAFNAPDSPLFAFLLSTRAGGVGINLATADTVLIMDPDFNPHQDLQALSRAHRIGQNKKVLVFQLLTKDSAEEKIVQIGRKKMALDQALIESMGAEDDAGVDLESILKYGAEALFNDDARNDIHYDSASVDRLLDRAETENTESKNGKTVESRFSFARVWANDRADLSGEIDDANSTTDTPNLSIWDKILEEREKEAAEEAARNIQIFGRGKRTRQAIDYQKNELDIDDEHFDSAGRHNMKKRSGGSTSDQDFAAAADSDPDGDSDPEQHGGLNPGELLASKVRSKGLVRSGIPVATETSSHRSHEASSQEHSQRKPIQHSAGSISTLQLGVKNRLVESISSNSMPPTQESQSQYPPTQPFKSSNPTSKSIHQSLNQQINGGAPIKNSTQQPIATSIPSQCIVCQAIHMKGQYCVPQNAPYCARCGIHHYRISTTCPNLASDVQLRLMLDSLAKSKQPRNYTAPIEEMLRKELVKRLLRKKNKGL